MNTRRPLARYHRHQRLTPHYFRRGDHDIPYRSFHAVVIWPREHQGLVVHITRRLRAPR